MYIIVPNLFTQVTINYSCANLCRVTKKQCLSSSNIALTTIIGVNPTLLELCSVVCVCVVNLWIMVYCKKVLCEKTKLFTTIYRIG